MQVAFISYIRKAVRKNTDILFIVQSVLGLLIFGLSIPDSESQKTYRQMGIILIFPALTNLILSLISRKCSESKAEKMTELITPIYLLGTVLCIIVIDMGLAIENVTSEMRM